MTEKQRQNQAKKAKIVASILRQESYTQDSHTYRKAFDGLMKLSKDELHAINLLLVFRVQESNELSRAVDKILAR